MGLRERDAGRQLAQPSSCGQGEELAGLSVEHPRLNGRLQVRVLPLAPNTWSSGSKHWER